MFPTAHSTIYRNEAGEILGWDNSYYDEPPDPDDFYREPTGLDLDCDDAYDEGAADKEDGKPRNENYSTNKVIQDAYNAGYEEN